MFSPAYRRYVLAALSSIYMVNLIDRGLMMLLLQPIKEDLSLSDTQLGLLTGMAFAFFYATLGLPIARWADRGNRVTISSIAIGVWGITVMGCLFVTSYAQLVVARISAAVGESGCKPPTYSLIGDYFPGSSERTTAMAVYLGSGCLSNLVSFMLGGALNDLYGWRITFFVMGIPGLFLAILIKLTVVEPRCIQSSVTDVRRADFAEAISTLWKRRSCRHLCAALILFYTMTSGLAPWYAAFMMRSHGMGTRELGIWFGLIFSVGGVTGALVGGFLSSKFFSTNDRSQMRLTAISVSMVVPCFIAFLELPGKTEALVVLIPFSVVLSVFLGPTYALMQRLVPDNMRATTLAVVMLLTNLIGMGVGPQVVGIASDLLQPLVGTDSLRLALLGTSLLAFWAAFHFWRVGGLVGQDLTDGSNDGPSFSNESKVERSVEFARSK